MNKEDSHIDKALKEKFDHHDFGTPPTNFLADINKRLDEDKRRKPFVWWMLNIALIFFFGTLLFYGQTKHKTSQLASITSKDKKTESTLQTRKISPEGENNVVLGDTIKDDAQKKTNNEQSIKHPLDPVKNIADPKALAHVKRQVQQDNKPENSRDTALNPPMKKENEQKVEKEKEQRILSSNKAAKTTEKTEPKPTDQFNNSRKNSFDVYTPEFGVVDNQIKNNSFQNLVKSPSMKDALPEVSAVLSKDSTDKKQSNGKPPFHIEIQGFGGISYGLPRISKSFSSEYSKLLKKYTENDELTPYFGINFNFVWNNLVLGTGIQYFQFDEEIEFTKWVTTTTKKELEIEQRYSWVSVPIDFGYRFQMGKNWAITPSVGGNVALGILRKTYQYPSNDFEQMDDYQYVKWILSLQGNIEVRRNFNNWHVFISGGYNFGLTPYINSNALQRKYSQINGVLGVGYSF